MAAAAGLAVFLALAVALLASGVGDGVVLPLTALSAGFATTPLVVRGSALAPAARALYLEGKILFYLATYCLSFEPFADATRFRSGLSSEGLLAGLPPFIGAVVALAIGLRRHDVDPHVRGEAMLLVGTVVALAAGLSLDTGSGTATIAKMSLAFLSVGSIVRGLSWHSRGPFMEGIAIAVVLAASHAFDFFPSLWVAVGAATFFFAAAACAIFGFERRCLGAPGAQAARR
jgi:hypothetical protein